MTGRNHHTIPDAIGSNVTLRAWSLKQTSNWLNTPVRPRRLNPTPSRSEKPIGAVICVPPILDWKIVNKSRNIAPIANHDHLMPARAPIDTDACRFIDVQHAKRRPRVNKNPEPVGMDGDGYNGHQIAPVTRVRKFYSRHAMSSSRGTRSTDGILLGSISRALLSTSFPESPTATKVSFTTATYFPAYFVTSSLKWSTIQRSSLSIVFSLLLQTLFDLNSKLSAVCESTLSRVNCSDLIGVSP